MAKEATLQVRMDADIKEQVEQLYKKMGTSFAEAVRMFAMQSIEDNAMPFVLHLSDKATGKRIGAAEGAFEVSGDIDACNDEIAKMFGGM